MGEQVLTRFPDDPKMRFSLSIEMTHPGVEADEVSKALGWEPGIGSVGETSQAGVRLRWGIREAWGGERRFFRRVVATVEHLEGRREFVRSYVEAGGEVVFTVRLFGQVNIGDVLAPEDIMRMAILGVALQIEVVTEWH